MPRKRFLLIPRKDRRLHGRAVYYVRFRLENGDLLAWKSTGRTSKVAAENWALDYIAKGHILTQENLTFRAYAEPWWSDQCPYCESRIARGASISNTYRRACRNWVRKYLLPAFGDTKLGQITPRIIESWLMELRKTTLTPSTINHLLKVLKVMLKEGVRLGYLTQNPAATIAHLKETPKVRGILTLQEIRKLFQEDTITSVWSDVRHYTLNLTAASCGLRLGEVLGLTIQFVHDEYLEINHSWGHYGEGLKSPKWGKTRIVPLPSRTSHWLAKVIEQSSYQEPTDLLFYGKSRDRPLCDHAVSRAFYVALEQIGLTAEDRRERALCFHSHRHGFNTYCRGKVPDELLRRIVGHSDERMTENYYHPPIESLKQIVSVQEGIFGDLPQPKQG